MELAHYLGLLHRAEQELARALREVAGAHADEPDVHHTATRQAAVCDDHVERLAPLIERYGETAEDEPERLHAALFAGPREGKLALLRDLHDLYLMAANCDITWTLVGQAARGARDEELQTVVAACDGQTATQLAWLRTRMKDAAPQALLVS